MLALVLLWAALRASNLAELHAWALFLNLCVAPVLTTGVCVVVVDEDNPRCSIAADLLALIAMKAFDHLDAPPRMVTAPHAPVPFSPPLEACYVPDAQQVVDDHREDVNAERIENMEVHKMIRRFDGSDKGRTIVAEIVARLRA